MIAKILKNFVDNSLKETFNYLRYSPYGWRDKEVADYIKDLIYPKAEEELKSYLDANFSLQDIINTLITDKIIEGGKLDS